MKTATLYTFAFALALIAGFGFASPILQIYNYSTVPSSVYAGTLGYLQVDLKNTGDATAFGTSAAFVVNGAASSISLGDLASGSDVQVAIPFQVSQAAAGGIQVVSVDFYYSDDTTSTATGRTTASTSKKVSLQVPVQVSQPTPLVARTVSIDNPSISPGEDVAVSLNLSNIGGTTNNIVVTTPANSSFSLEGASQQAVGTIAPGASQMVLVNLLASSSTTVGTYNVPLTFTYYDKLNRPNSVELSVGPLSVQDASSEARLSVRAPSSVEIGSKATLHVTLSNAGTRSVSAVVDLNSSDVFSPIGAQRLYFDSVAPGSSSSQDVEVGVSPSASAGYYLLPLQVTPSSGNAFGQSFGLSVTATPQLSISLDQSGEPAQVMLANTGNSQVRSVDVTVTSESNPREAPVRSFIGTLNVDDYSSVSLASGASGTLNVEVTFRDSSNQPHTITRQLDAGSSGLSFMTNGTGTVRSGTVSSLGGRPATGGLLGGLLGGRPGGSTGASGLPLPLILAALVVVAIAAFLLWRHFKGKKKKETA
ncbi:Uncharacterised protein [uncultured archaeon]|nr:Uncharacterised protein [uncultured archaeon]